MPWLALAAAITVVNGAALRYLAAREQSRASLVWSWAWLSWAGAVVPLMLLGSRAEPSPLHLLVGLLWAASALCFLRGSYALLERAMPRIWYGVAVAAALGAFGLVAAGQVALAMAPLAAFQCAGLVGAGVVVLRGARRETGAWLYGGALTVLGAHVLDAPLVMRFPELVPWGFAFALSLEVMAGLGMVALHYEKARERLLRAERSLEQARRVEALGRVAGGVAHDFNNMLTILQAHAELLRSKQPGSEAVSEATSGIEEVIDRGARLVRQLLAFGRRSETQLGSIDVRETVQGTLDLLEKVVPKNIELELRCQPGDYAARLDRALLEQVVLNLVTNARDAIDGSGSIRVELQRHAVSQAIVLRVADTGVGMAPELIERVFEPFFTTKESEHGTGLGLASVEGAVHQLGGTIRVESQLGRGSTFEVVLPARPGEEKRLQA